MKALHEEMQGKSKGRHRKRNVLLIIVVIILLAIIVVFIFVNAYISRSQAKVEGELDLPGLEHPVHVIKDDHGVPHINAENEHDLYMAQGYIQAQDRLLQMELSRRQASGTLSEVVGDKAVDSDKYFRTLGLRRAAESSLDRYSDAGKDVLQWFADGVNTYRKQAIHAHRLPVEFTLMGSKPAKWSPIDSLTIGKYMAFDLGGHWEQQAFNYYALNHFSDDKAEELLPDYPKDKPTILEDDDIDIAGSFAKAVIPHPFNGSNNWVVSGDKTKSGKPLLANDPHLGLKTPSIWYQMHLQADDVNVDGVIFAGVPGIILGHNDNIAWGVTNTGPDVQQLYKEKRNPKHKDEFLYDDKWEKADVIDEPIKVKGKKPIDYQVTETRHGPVISEFAEESGKNNVMSLQWTALQPTTELEAILNLDKAKNWKEFEKGLEDFLAPAQNFVFAGKDGTIAYKANGKIPIYKDGEDALLPLKGWDKADDWQGYIPFDELPKTVNPDEGFIATANNKITGDDYPYHISNVWAQPYRYERIAEVLEASDELTAKDMEDLQMDQTNLQAREFIPKFTDALADATLTKPERKALDALNDWNQVDRVDASQPLIFHRWLDEIKQTVYDDDIPDSMMDLFENSDQTMDELLRMGDESSWIKANGGLEKLLQTTLHNTVKNLTTEYGDDPTDWQWGDYHQVLFKHPLSDVNPVLKHFFNPEDSIPVGGSHVTPMAASYASDTGIVDHGASWRFVIDARDMTTGYHIVGPGQAGHFKSKWYHDQLHDWVDGHYHKTHLDETSGKELTLNP